MEDTPQQLLNVKIITGLSRIIRQAQMPQSQYTLLLYSDTRTYMFSSSREWFVFDLKQLLGSRVCYFAK